MVSKHRLCLPQVKNLAILSYLSSCREQKLVQSQTYLQICTLILHNQVKSQQKCPSFLKLFTIVGTTNEIVFIEMCKISLTGLGRSTLFRRVRFRTVVQPGTEVRLAEVPEFFGRTERKSLEAFGAKVPSPSCHLKYLECNHFIFCNAFKIVDMQ